MGNYILSAVQNILKQDKVNTYYLFNSGLKNKINIDQTNIIHLSLPNKLINLGLSLQIGPDIFKKINVPLDLFWLPNINFYKFDKSIPTVLTIHDLSWLHRPAFYSFKRKIWHRAVNIQRLIQKSSKIIAVSENTKRDIIRFFNTDPDKISVIYPGLDAGDINQEAASQFIRPFALPEKYFIYVGTLEPRKNIESVIAAFDRYHQDYPDIALVIVGSRGWLYKKLIKDFQKRDYIYYLGYVDKITRDALYFMSQGLIWPSFYEGFGLPPLEAIVHGVPVVTSYKASLPEILKNQSLYVDPYNISDIYQTLICLTRDQTLRQQFQKSATDFDLPDWSRQAQGIIKLFNTFKKQK